MKKTIPALGLLCLLACKSSIKEKVKDQNAAFNAYKERFIENLWRLYPGWASSVGYHNYDSVLVVSSSGQRSSELAFMQANSDSLKNFNLQDLSDNNKTDYHLLSDYLTAGAWNIAELKAWEWDPSAYNVCGAFADMLGNNYDSLDTRLENFYRKMANVPLYYSQAKNNIKNPTLVHTELAVEQNLGGLPVFEADLPAALNRSHLSAEKKEAILTRAAKSISAIKDYAGWLKQLKNEKPRSFRLGEKLYLKKFEYEIQSGYSASQIFEKAIAHKKELHEKMFALTQQLWPKYFKDQKMPAERLDAIQKMIDRLSEKHVAADSFQLAIEQQIPKLVEFVNKKQLIYLDPSKPLVVRKEPAYMAGLAGASISSPGPYDKNGNTYYNVGSLAGWPKERAESYLREYNHYILQILNIHEAIPGHYTQLIYSNQSPSIVKAVFGNGAMVEGWAVYTERMMLESGYGAAAGSSEAEPEMWLMYYKWNLRSTCNTILDYSVHAKNMTEDEALHLLVKEAFQQQAEAQGKWHRVCISQVQLCSYFTGYTEIYDFRSELMKKAGGGFNLKKFHETFLSYGSAPVKYIRALMLADTLH